MFFQQELTFSKPKQDRAGVLTWIVFMQERLPAEVFSDGHKMSLGTDIQALRSTISPGGGICERISIANVCRSIDANAIEGTLMAWGIPRKSSKFVNGKGDYVKPRPSRHAAEMARGSICEAKPDRNQIEY